MSVDADDDRLDDSERRAVLKAIGAATAGTLAASSSNAAAQSGSLPPVLSGLEATAGGLGAGVWRAPREFFASFSDDWSDVESTIKAQNAYSTAVSLVAAFERPREEFEYIAERGRFEDNLWAEVRAAGYRAFEDDQDADAALDDAQDRMDDVLADALRSAVAAANAELESNIPIIEVHWDVDNTTNNGYIDADFEGSYDPDDFWSEGSEPYDTIDDCPETTLLDGWRGYCAIEVNGSTMPDDEPIELLCLVSEAGNTGGDRNINHPWFEYAEEEGTIDDEYFGLSGGIGA